MPLPFRHDTAAAIWAARAEFEQGPSLDDRTWIDLDMDAVLEAINRTASMVGQAALYRRLRRAPVPDQLDAFESLVTRFESDESARTKADRALKRLQDKHGYDVWWLAKPGAIKVRQWYVIFPLLTLVTFGLVALMLVRHAFMPNAIVAIVGINLAVRFMTGEPIFDLRRAIRQLGPLITVGQKLTFLRDDAAAPLIGTLPEDAATLRPLKMMARWGSDDPLMLASQDDPVTYIASGFLNSVYEFLNTILLLDGNALFFAQHALVEHHQALIRLVDAIGTIDSALSVAVWRAERDDWTRPLFVERPPVVEAGPPPIVIEHARHPLVDDAVLNDVTLTPGRGMVITGSNMSGKSTYLRTAGVNVVLAQTLHTCLASRYEAPLLNVESCIGRADDILAGKSYYLVEVEQVLSRLRASASATTHVFLFDELFRGTNAIERIAAGEAVLRALVSGTPHVVLAATHDAELVGLLHDVYDPYYFADTVTDEGLQFDYRLHAGTGTGRNAIALLAQRGAPAAVIARATATAASLEQQRGT